MSFGSVLITILIIVCIVLIVFFQNTLINGYIEGEFSTFTIFFSSTVSIVMLIVIQIIVSQLDFIPSPVKVVIAIIITLLIIRFIFNSVGNLPLFSWIGLVKKLFTGLTASLYSLFNGSGSTPDTSTIKPTNKKTKSKSKHKKDSKLSKHTKNTSTDTVAISAESEASSKQLPKSNNMDEILKHLDLEELRDTRWTSVDGDPIYEDNEYEIETREYADMDSDPGYQSDRSYTSSHSAGSLTGGDLPMLT